MYADNYNEIMLSFKEKHILYCILKKQKVSYTFCNDQQLSVFLKHELITIQQKQTVTPSGRVVPDPNAPKFIQATDKTLRYFLYRKESFFQGKFPVVIAFIALIKSCDAEICWLFHFITGWLSKI
jgi:hypothetical protein